MLTADKEQNCKEGDVVAFDYSRMIQQYNVFLVSHATFINPGAPIQDKDGKVTPDNEIEVVGQIEFEYWVENVVQWSDFVFYGFIGILGFGLCTCCVLLLVYRTTLEEEMTDLTSSMWKLKGKSKDYLKENAPQALELVSTAQANAVDPVRAAADPAAQPKPSKRARIRALHNELEAAWCCSEGLVPVRSPARAAILCFLNFILPGLGTVFSACCASKQKDPPPTVDPLAAGADEEDKEDAAPRPPVVNVDHKRPWSRGQAFATGIGQLFTASCGMGWIWSISHGLILYENAKLYKKIDEIEREPDDEEDDGNDFGAALAKENAVDNMFG